ncbi:MAG: hypothetical protein JSS68_08580 [Actinobacteria bacterium]|nr:hypothetical protein [Actinomycetota bacterium]
MSALGYIGGVLLIASLAGVHLKLPTWVPWAVIGGSFFAANLWVFHDVRTERDSAAVPRDVRRRIEDELGVILNEGGWLADECATNYATRPREANPLIADWWDRAGVFIEAVLGTGERHIVSTPLRASTGAELVQKRCDLLRKVIERLPNADIRSDDESLARAIEIRRKPPDNASEAPYLTPLS